jgi:hypothetical protein
LYAVDLQVVLPDALHLGGQNVIPLGTVWPQVGFGLALGVQSVRIPR